MSVNYFYKINYFDHFYFIRVYLNLFHAVLLAIGIHPIDYDVDLRPVYSYSRPLQRYFIDTYITIYSSIFIV